MGSKGTKVIAVTDISKYDEGTFRNLLATLSQQDFSFDSPKFSKYWKKIQTINSEMIQQVKLKLSRKPKARSQISEIINHT